DGPSEALLQEIFRAAHTIKGSGAAIGHVRMARLTHAWETLLDKLRHGELSVSPGLLDRFFEALDVLKVLAGEVEALAAALEAWAAGEAAAEAAATPAAQPARAVRPTTLPAPDGATHHVLL